MSRVTHLNRTSRRRLALAIVTLVVVGFNTIAFMQAHAMTHFAASGARTAKPEQLGLADKVATVLFGVNVPRPENSHTPADVGLKYDTRNIAVGDGRLEAWYVPRQNSRGLVVLFHGYEMSKDALLSPAAAFYELGYDALLVDFRGSGGSSGDDTTLGVREGVDVKAALEYARTISAGKPVILYGFSMGAAAILRSIAYDGAQPDALILESGFDRLLTTVGHRFEALGLPSFPGAQAVVFWGSVQLGFNGFSHNPVDYAGAVTQPALVLHGEQDPRVTTGEAASVAANMRGPHQYIEYPGVGHDLLLDGAPTKWKTAVGSFLTQYANQQ